MRTIYVKRNASEREGKNVSLCVPVGSYVNSTHMGASTNVIEGDYVSYVSMEIGH